VPPRDSTGDGWERAPFIRRLESLCRPHGRPEHTLRRSEIECAYRVDGGRLWGWVMSSFGWALNPPGLPAAPNVSGYLAAALTARLGLTWRRASRTCYVLNPGSVNTMDDKHRKGAPFRCQSESLLFGQNPSGAVQRQFIRV
jgi:hypothetical protein